MAGFDKTSDPIAASALALSFAAPAFAQNTSTALNGQLNWGDVVADIFRNRVLTRGKGAEVWGWGTAYGTAQGQKS